MFRATASIISRVGLLLVAVTFSVLHCVYQVPDQIANRVLISNRVFQKVDRSQSCSPQTVCWRTPNSHYANQRRFLISSLDGSVAFASVSDYQHSTTDATSNQRVCECCFVVQIAASC